MMAGLTLHMICVTMMVLITEFTHIGASLSYPANYGENDNIYPNKQIASSSEQDIIKRAEIQIENYLNEVKRTLDIELQHTVHKRSPDLTISRINGIDIFRGFEEIQEFTVPAKFPNDIIYYSKCTGNEENVWYAAALESDGSHPQTSYANKLVLYKQAGGKFVEVHEKEVKGGIRVAVHEIQGNVYIVVAEHEAGALGRPLEGSKVYTVNNVTDKLDDVQTLNTKFPSDILIWENHHMHKVFVAVSIAQDNNTGIVHYSTQSYVWQWRGSHFDIVDVIPTNNPRSVIHFTVGNNMYIAFANHKNDYNETDINSEIFRYNIHSGNFSLYQKLRTHAAVDIKYFCFESNERTEGFLVVANNYERDEYGNINYITNSIIYKLSDEEYFIPFQSITLYGASQWLPVSDNSNNNRGFVLLVATMEGIVSFQYDGWKFVRTSVSYTLSTFGPGVSTMRSFLYGNQTVFTISNKRNDGSNINVFKATFTYDPSMDKFFDDMEDWCRNTLQEVNNTKLEELIKAVQEAPSNNMTDVYLNSSIHFTDVSIDTLITNSSVYVDQINNNLDQLSRELDEAEKLFAQYNRFPELYVSGDVHLSKADISCPGEGCDLNSLTVTNLNGENFLEFIQNAVKLSDEINYNGQLEFENLAIQGELDVEVVNGHPVDALVDWSKDNNFAQGLEVKGNVTLKSGMQIGGYIDGVIIENDKVLLRNEDQFLSGQLILEEATVDQLTVRNTLNGWNINAITDPDYYVLSTEKSIDSLNTSQLLLDDGLISGIDFGNLNVSALKLNGDQIVTANHRYENIKANRAIIEGTLSGINLKEEVVPVSSDDLYVFPGELHFDLPIEYNILSRHDNTSGFPSKVTEDSAPYSDGYYSAGGARASSQPNDQTEMFDNDEDSHPLVIKGDLVINGTVTVHNGHLVTEDLINTEKNISLKQILHSGLLLNETDINNSIHFSTPFKVNSLNVTTINGVKPENFLLVNESEVVTVSGHKIFKDRLHLDNTYTVTGFVNGVNISQLLSDTLRKTGDQIITGDKNISSMFVKKIKSNGTYFGTVSWSDILKLSENQNFSGGIGTINSLVVTENVTVDNLTINGTISGFNIDELLEDSAYTDDKVYNVTGFKNFTGVLKVEHLSTPSISGLETSKLLSIADDGSTSVTWTTSVLELPKSITIKNLNFSGSLDGIEARDFGQWLLIEGDQTIIGQQTFRENINAQGGISIMKGGTINNVNVDNIILNARRIDNDEEFTEEITFENSVISNGDIIVKGTIQGIDLSKEALLSESTETQQIVGHKTFSKDVTVTGSVLNIDNISGINLSAFCQAIVSNSSHLHVTGSATLSNAPKVTGTFNNISLDTLLKNVWLENENITINETMEFGDVVFLKNVTVKGLVNDISINKLASEYISLSKDQTVTGNTYFLDGLVVDGDLIGNSVVTGKNVSGLDLQHFVKNVMLDGEDQTVTAEWDFLFLSTTGVLNTSGYVNDLNLSSEVMRTDVPVNYVRGHTQIRSINTKYINIPAKTKVHGVDVKEWNRTAVKKTGDFVITGNKTFKGTVNILNDISVGGMVNDIQFDKDNLMLLHQDQVITGRHVYDEGSYVYVSDLGISGCINDVNMTELLERQAYTNGNITINGHMNFTKPLRGTYVHLPEMYGGFNLTNISTIINTPLPVEQYERELRMLHQINDTAQKSLSAAGYYLKNYTKHSDMSLNFLGAVPIKSSISEILLLVSEPKSMNRSQFTIYEWKPDTGMFVMKTGLKNVSLLTTPVSYQSVVTEDGQFLMYIESGSVNSSKGMAPRSGTTRWSLLLRQSEQLDPAWYQDMCFHGGMVLGVLVGQSSSTMEIHTLRHILKVEMGELLQLKNNSIMHLEGFPVTMQSSVITFTDEKLQSYYLVVEKQGQYCIVYQHNLKKNILNRRKPRQCQNATQVASVSTEDNVYMVISRTGNQSCIDVWKFIKRTSRLVPYNSVPVHNPVSVTMITHRNRHYVAVANKHIVGNARPESVDIYRFQSDTGDLSLLQSIPVTSPLNIKFCQLPSDELVLYIMTENPATPFIVYNYRGLAGFKEWLIASTLPLIKDFIPITDNSNDKHLVIMTNHDKIMVLEAVFEGKKIYN